MTILSVDTAKSIAEWLGGVVIFRYMFLPWLGKQLAELLKKWFVKTEKDLVTLLHYQKKHPLPSNICADEECVVISKTQGQAHR